MPITIDQTLRNTQKPNDSNSPLDVFYYYVRSLVVKSDSRAALLNPMEAPINRFYNHQEAANLIFGNGLDYVSYITLMLDNFGNYFEFQDPNIRDRFKANFIKITKEHPYCLIRKHESKDINEILFEVLVSLGHEMNALNEFQFGKLIELRNVNKVFQRESLFVYEATIQFERDEMPAQFPEGIMVEYKCGVFSKRVTVLEHDIQTNKLIFQSNNGDLIGHNPKIQLNSTFLIENIRKKLEDFDISKNDFLKLYTSIFEPIPIIDSKEIWSDKLDESQFKAIENTLKRDVSFIWGPPGTGKTHTLARLILNFCQRNERTLVCCIANTAVDTITHKFVDVLQKNNTKNDLLKNGEIVRLGYTRDRKLLAIDQLFPETEDARILRGKILDIEEILDKLDKKNTQINELLSKRTELKNDLVELLRHKINNAKVVFCTITKALLEDDISYGKFDNIIIDEASMVSPGIALGLMSMITKRLVVTGDPMQLGPIAISNSGPARTWLHTSMFDLIKGDLSTHPCVSILKDQRRSAPAIAELVNKVFYQGLLINVGNKRQKSAIHVPTLEGHISFLDIGQDPNYRVQYSASHSRYNQFSIDKVSLLLKKYKHNLPSGSTVGIITPYRAQASKYQELIERLSIKNELGLSVRAGTIHSFQGSECDVIIFDMVDSLIGINGELMRIGNLYYRKQGEQLMNVAITRAISKLIIVGCSRVLSEGLRHGQVNRSIKQILLNVMSYKYDPNA